MTRTSAQDRRLDVLRAIVTQYVATREPVGSKAIAAGGLGVSSATIRNDMAVLEEAGLIYQPHTSAGRVTTDRRYREVPADEMPVGESLKDTIARVLPYWDSNIAPELRQGKNVLISAHGNSLRALIKYLLNISDEQILELNLPTGTPLIFDLDDKLNIVSAPELF